MNARVIRWFEEDDPRDLRRWAIAALVIVGIHALGIGGYVYLDNETDDIGRNSTPIVVDIAPGEDARDQPEVAPTPDQQQPPPEAEKPPETPPPPPDTDAVIPQPEKVPEKVEQQPPQQYIPAMTAATPYIDTSWESTLTRRLQHFKRYPGGAQSRGEEGVVLLGFVIDRSGHVLEHQIVKSSGFPDLDAEVSSLIKRADPLPAFPPTMTASTLEFTVPIRFSLH
ncbi:MAG TPA: energy transducer TonB [Xanthobacteraceae bacterium]|jgi:protein TonB|nr:energy transducer TonB [Xanthobacteraceae bacterium]